MTAADQTNTQQQRSRWLPNSLSLKWKAVLLVLLVLIPVIGSMTVFNNQMLEKEGKRQRQQFKDFYSAEMETMIHESWVELENIVALIPKLAGMRSTLLTSDSEQIRRIFDFHWPLLRDKMNVAVVRFYGPDGRLLAGWSREGLEDEARAELAEWVGKAQVDREAKKDLYCDVFCLRFVAVPLEIAGNDVGFVVLASSLSDIAKHFSDLSGTRTLLVEDSLSGLKIVADHNPKPDPVPDGESSDPVRGEFMDHCPDYSTLRGGCDFQVQDGETSQTLTYVPTPIQLTARDIVANGYVVLLPDFTEQLRDIQLAKNRNRQIGIAGIMLASGLILALLWGPLTRLRQMSAILPLLGRGSFRQVRRSLAGRHPGPWLKDEVDILRDTAHGLSFQLEELEAQVAERTHDFGVQMRELTTERDFVRSLLDTAQVIVLTQNRNRQVVMMNRYGEDLTGYTGSELASIPFQRFVETEDGPDNLYGLLGEVISGTREFERHEARLRCKDGSMREIAWLHSRLGLQSHQQGVILSIGLDITERKQAEVRLSWLADHDPLSGLINRRRFQQELQRSLLAAQRHEQSGALLFFDLDHFKYVNDASGHHAGDMLLQLIAHTITKVVRSTDTVARLGGDEFAVLMEQTDEKGAIQAAQKIIKHLGAINFPFRGRSHKVAASIGIALFPTHGSDMNDVLSIADLAMYQAKEAGRGTWHLFSPDDLGRERTHQTVYWKEQVEQALAMDRFVMHYQPIVNLQTRQTTHYEALLRMTDASGKLIMPESFIGVCEHTGLIHRIDHMVLEKAIRDVRQMVDNGLEYDISVNLSAHAFEDPELLTVLNAQIAEHDVEPARLIFEITETAAVADFAAARGMMRSIRELGCHFSLDDFGVGFASFYSLKQLPVDLVKIDGSFIQHLAENRDDQIFVRAMSEVVKGFGKKSVAEFVETDMAAELLRSYGVDYAQGYHIGKPVPLELLLEQSREPVAV